MHNCREADDNTLDTLTV